MSKQIKITRTLFVGLGGTGVKAILRAKQCFMDAYGEIPPMVAFLAVDTDKAIKDKSLPSRKGGDVRLQANEVCFCGITGSALDIYRMFPNEFQWLPKRNISFLSNLQGTGAGAVRSNGRFLARHNADQISKQIANKVREISQPLPLDSRFIYDTNQEGMQYDTIVNVVGSVAGGTGSGMFIDMITLISKTLKDNGLDYRITPWIVLPDIFRHIAPGPASVNVFQNTYGAIRELDYLYHLSENNQSPLDFGFDKVYYRDEKLGDAYLINSTNKAGVVFQTVEDLTDSIGRCMFLPSNEVDSVQDNVRIVQFTYAIENKRSFYQSAGSAEIVYDNQAVGNVIARGIISRICEELVKSSSVDQILKEVYAWTTSETVAIQEHDVNQLTDSLLPLYAPFSIIIDKEADVNTISANIIAGAEAQNVIDEVKNNELKKFQIVKTELNKKLELLLDSLNGIGATKAFLESLTDNIAECKNEMYDEVAKLKTTLAYEINWSAEISQLWSGSVFRRFDQDAADALQSKIAEYIAQKRDLLRHNWAIQFYTDLEEYVKGLLKQIDVLKLNVEAIEKLQRKEITAIQNLARSTSLFQIYLHLDDVTHFQLPDASSVASLFRTETSIYSLLGKSPEEIQSVLFAFAKKQPSVVGAVNVTIEEKMRSMSDEKLKSIFTKVKEMSSPLWSLNTQGYAKQSKELTTVFTIGVQEQSRGIIQDKFKDEFTFGPDKPTFASTHETDRITFFQTQCYSPAYAINNLRGYMKDSERLNNSGSFPVCYLDEKWNQRMISEGFDIMPKKEKDQVFPNWVLAIVFGLIKYDDATKNYIIKSKQGKALFGGRLELGERRDLAFDQFELRGLDKEVDELLKKKRVAQGQVTINTAIQEIQNDMENYVTKYAQLSAIELDRVLVEDHAYQMVTDLLTKEIEYLNDLEF